MAADLNYRNAYFGLCIDFPDNWELVSIQHVNSGSSLSSQYQARDDDLPDAEDCPSKFLFTASLYSPQSHALVDADVELSVFRLTPGEDMRRTLIQNFERQRGYSESNGIVTSIAKQGTWLITGAAFDYVEQASASRRGLSQYRFFFRSIDDIFWLYGKIAGHSESAYGEAVRIVDSMQCKMADSSA